MHGTEECAKAIAELGKEGVSASKAAVRLGKALSAALYVGLQEGTGKHVTNNWRKMHGLPMRRRLRCR